MGCDGGTIPKRDELVKKKKKEEEKDRDADLAAKWKYCALSSTRLRPPIVSCPLGRLYNKEAVIEFLLKKQSSDIADHIKSLKDVVQLKLTEKKDYSEKSDNGEHMDTQDSQFICPVVGLEMSGKYRFCYIRGCGCVISERALKEVKTDNCHGCGKSFDSEEDVVVINGTPEEVEQLRKRMVDLKQKAKADKKSKKRKVAASGEDINGEETSQSKNDAPSTSSNFVSSSSSTSSSAPQTSKTSTKTILPEKALAGYSVAKDPNASEAYKSLFTTHETAKKKPKGNWVTYNPLYF